MQDKGKTSYTPGPWAWVDNGGCSTLKGKGGKTVCDDGSAWGEYSQAIDPSGPDALLISKAPELVEMVRGLLKAHNSGVHNHNLADDAQDLLAEIDGEG